MTLTIWQQKTSNSALSGSQEHKCRILLINVIKKKGGVVKTPQNNLYCLNEYIELICSLTLSAMLSLSLKLSLGRVTCSHAATVLLDRHDQSPWSLLLRWQQGDWGEVELHHPTCQEIFEQNSKAIAAQAVQGRIIGVYPIGSAPTVEAPDSRERIWVSGCPFAGKGAITTILLMSEF